MDNQSMDAGVDIKPGPSSTGNGRFPEIPPSDRKPPMPQPSYFMPKNEPTVTVVPISKNPGGAMGGIGPMSDTTGQTYIGVPSQITVPIRHTPQIQSHLKLLQANKVNIYALTTAEEVINVIHGLQHAKRKRPISDNYKSSILRTIKLILGRNPDIARIPATTIAPYRQRAPLAKRFSAKTYQYLTLLVYYVLTYSINDQVSITFNRTMYDVIIAVLIVVGTNTKTSDAFSLTLEDFYALYNNNNAIRLNRPSYSTVINTIPDIFPRVKEQILNVITKRNERFQMEASMKPERQINLFRVISCSQDVINKKIKLLLIEIMKQNIDNSVGLNSFKHLDRRILLDNLYVLSRHPYSFSTAPPQTTNAPQNMSTEKPTTSAT